MHGRGDDLDALRRGLGNLEKHLESIGHFGERAIVAINRFGDDTDEEIAAIAERHEPAGAAEVLLAWWREAPETFSVIRDRDDVVVGFFSLLDTAAIRRARGFDDPVVDEWAQHLLDNPLPKGQVALALRRWLDAETGDASANEILQEVSVIAGDLDDKAACVKPEPVDRHVGVRRDVGEPRAEIGRAHV